MGIEPAITEELSTSFKWSVATVSSSLTTVSERPYPILAKAQRSCAASNGATGALANMRDCERGSEWVRVSGVSGVRWVREGEWGVV